MTTVLDVLDHGPGEWQFRLFGTDVRVQIWFWVSIVMMAGRDDARAAVIWIVVCFVSVMLHEFGHVAAMRLVGERPEVVLSAWGGMTTSNRLSSRNVVTQVVVSMAGPVAGFCLAGIVLAIAHAAGAQTGLRFHLYVIPSLWSVFSSGIYLNVFVNDLLFVNFYLGLMNLLPIYPLDGGQTARALLEQYMVEGGRRRAFLVSAITAAIVAVLGVFASSIFMVVLFGVLGAASAQEYEKLRPAIRGRYSDP